MQNGNAIKVVSANMGNQMFRYMLAKVLELQTGTFNIGNTNLPEWGIVQPLIEESGYTVIRTGPVHAMDLGGLIERLRTETGLLIELDCYAQRVEYYEQYRDIFRKIFHSEEQGQGVGSDEILINVRAGDILGGGHPDYVPVPVSYYQHIVETTGLKPVFLGQIKDNWYMARIKEIFPNARYVTGGSPLGDFQSIRNARNIVVSVSSFSWLAAWLSEAADRIFMPLLGMMNPAQRPDVNLVARDSRYVYSRFPVLRYDARDEHKRILLARQNPVTWG